MKKFKLLREQFLSEAYSRRVTDKDVDKLFKSMRDPEGFYGDLDKARAEMKLNDYHPGNSARPKVWTALRYPVRNGDYYFAFIDKNERKNMKYNEKLNDALKTAKVGGDKKSEDDLWLVASNELRTYPASLGWNDTMTREEVYGAIQHMLGKIKESNVIENSIKTKAGVMVGKRMKAPKYESATVSEAMKMKDIARKHKKELQNAAKKGSLELSKKAEEDLMQWAMDNGEVNTDDPDDFIEWLDNNLDDIIKGKIK